MKMDRPISNKNYIFRTDKPHGKGKKGKGKVNPLQARCGPEGG